MEAGLKLYGWTDIRKCVDMSYKELRFEMKKLNSELTELDLKTN